MTSASMFVIRRKDGDPPACRDNTPYSREHMSASHSITRYVLRTTDVAAARAFYTAVLGHDRLPIVPLHEQALARGARPHWLGQIEVHDVEHMSRAFVAYGAEALGPVVTLPDGRRLAVFRDPGGAIIGLTSSAAHDEPPLVVWHHLNTNNKARVEEAYTTLFGWRLTQCLGHPEHGELQHFAWPGSDVETGTIVDIQGRPGRHPHWLFHMHVTNLDDTLAAVRAAHGLVLGPFALPSGERLAVCDDPQGAAFALRG